MLVGQCEEDERLVDLPSLPCWACCAGQPCLPYKFHSQGILIHRDHTRFRKIDLGFLHHISHYPVPSQGQQHSFLQRLVRGMPRRLAKCRANKFGACGKRGPPTTLFFRRQSKRCGVWISLMPRRKMVRSRCSQLFDPHWGLQ